MLSRSRWLSVTGPVTATMATSVDVGLVPQAPMTWADPSSGNSCFWEELDQFQDFILEIILELVSHFSILLWAVDLLDNLVINFEDFPVALLVVEWAVALELEDVEVQWCAYQNQQTPFYEVSGLFNFGLA